MAKVECVLEARSWLGEGPCWHPGEQALYWTDVPGKLVHRWHPKSGEHQKWRTKEMVAAISVRAKGGLIVASHTGIDFFDPKTGETERFVEPEKEKPQNRSNDGKCDRQGRFWYGTMMNNFAADMSEAPITANTGGLYRIDPNGSVHVLDQGIGIANTFAWSPDNSVMYFGDTLDAIYAYDFHAESGVVHNRRVFGKLDTNQYGHPDGSTIDAQGFLWNARWDGGCLIRWSPDGKVDRIVKLPCRRVTSCIFGGPRLDILYVTTVRYGLSDADLAEQPLAGGIFAIDAGVKGVPDGQFAG
ncbi:MAG TPA: SMP-30/gluconolactonase/LRE family protein [Methylomirabilota bacterium]|nr:SMP-30/gluconolactonase/LRE family protein [Methylomirabilota bacterium]